MALPRPTPKNLREVLGMKSGASKAARLLREAEDSTRPQDVEKALDAVEEIMQEDGATFGTEPIRGDSFDHPYFADAVALYINTGDTYNGTVVYDVERDKFYVTSWGDWVEDYERRTGKVLS